MITVMPASTPITTDTPSNVNNNPLVLPPILATTIRPAITPPKATIASIPLFNASGLIPPSILTHIAIAIKAAAIPRNVVPKPAAVLAPINLVISRNPDMTAPKPAMTSTPFLSTDASILPSIPTTIVMDKSAAAIPANIPPSPASSPLLTTLVSNIKPAITELNPIIT